MTQAPAFAHPPWVYVFVDDATDGHSGFIRIREGDGSPGAVVLAVRGAEVALVEVFRRPLGQVLLELPRGFANTGETIRRTAARELAEETGLTVDPDALVDLGLVAPNSGVLESVVGLFLAIIPEREGALAPADAEVGSAQWVPVDDVLAMAEDGRIIDGFTLAALLRAYLRGLLPGGASHG